MRLIGHRRQVESLKRPLAEDSLNHCYLFTGPQGIGKKQVALWLAYHWLHPEKPLIEPQTAISDDADLRCEQPEGSTFKRGQVDAVIESLQKKPFGGRGRAVILDDFHRATVSAQNTLLKTLEEPQVRQLVILVTHDVDKLLPTVRSRAQEVKFDPPKETDYEIRGFAKTDPRLTALIAMNRGAVGPVLESLKAGVVPQNPAVVTWLTQCPNAKHKTYATAKALASKEETEVFAVIGQYLSDLIAVSQGLTPVYYPLCHQAMSHQMRLHTTSDIQQALEAMETAQKALTANVNRELVWENLCLTIEEVFS